MRLEHAVLQTLYGNGGPIGSGTLHLLLRNLGVRISAPTIGRKLRELEFQGLVRKSSVDGRVITDRGREVLERWDRHAELEGKSRAFLRLIDSADKKHILDLLGARRVIETQVAALAAMNVSPAAVHRLEQLIQRQAEDVERGGLGIEEDVRFHEEIAEASGNTVLKSIVSILRGNPHYNYLITFMRATVGSRLIVDHSKIFVAIKSGNPDGARVAMDQHLAALEEDVKRYWKRWVGSGRAWPRRRRGKA